MQLRDTTSSALIVAEAMHDSASTDVARLVATIADEIAAVWSAPPKTAIVSESSPGFDYG